MGRMRRRGTSVQPGGLAVLEPPLAELQPSERLGALLLAAGAVRAPELDELLCSQDGVRLGELGVRKGLVSEDAVARAVATQFSLPFLDLGDTVPDADALAAVDRDAARELGLLPVRVGPNGQLDVVVTDPTDERLPAVLSQLPAVRVRVCMASPALLRSAVRQCFGGADGLSDLANEATSTFATDDAAATDVVSDDAPVIQLVNRLVAQALHERASDVHIEPTHDQVRVRFRIDGSLKEVVSFPASIARPLVSRIKIMAAMNIVESRRPQDGQFRLSVAGRELDVRVSTTATIWGEKTVLRLLDKSRALLRLSDLGMPPATHHLYSQLTHSPYGMLVVSGPTGSGKTTTLYATLAEVNRPDINVMTIEDPVEYVVPTINQIQINEQANITFAGGLKSILRQDPDVILVGEVRDVETARIAVQSALTGHFVLSSLHATDTVSALYRLLNMGVEPFAVASSIVGMVAQRLVRRVCRACAVETEPNASELAFYRHYGGGPNATFLRGTGCEDCAQTGYFDRIGVYEVLAVSDDLRQALVAGAAPAELRRIAEARGLRTLRQAAMDLVAAGTTTVDEVLKTVYVAEGAQ